MFDRPPLSRAPHARLNFIYNEQNIVFVAQLAQSREKVIRWIDIPALALDGFNQDASHILARQQPF